MLFVLFKASTVGEDRGLKFWGRGFYCMMVSYNVPMVIILYLHIKAETPTFSYIRSLKYCKQHSVLITTEDTTEKQLCAKINPAGCFKKKKQMLLIKRVC